MGGTLVGNPSTVWWDGAPRGSRGHDPLGNGGTDAVREKVRERLQEPLKAATSLPCTEAAELMNPRSPSLMLIIRSTAQRHACQLRRVIQVGIRAQEDSQERAMQIDLRWRLPLTVTTAP